MVIKTKNNFIEEDIIDENGNILGKIRFNPSDSRIMRKLTKIVNDLGKVLKEVDNLGDIPKIPENELKNLKDFEEVASTFEKLEKGYKLEEEAVDGVITDLTEIFGKETIEVFTGGTKDIMSLMPLIEFIMPYVKNDRESKINKYIPKNNDVMN